MNECPAPAPLPPPDAPRRDRQPLAPIHSGIAGLTFAQAGALVLLLSFSLRACLAWRGGQFFWPDEDRFDLTCRAVRLLQAHEYRAALEILFGQADHLLFKLAALVPAFVQIGLHAPAWVASLFFAAASTWVLALVPRVARVAGASAPEQFLALFLAACTTSLFYYARHYFPYDLSLAFLLLALIPALRPAPGWRDSLLAGIWAGLGFLAYNGYWTLAGAILILHVLRALPRSSPLLRRAVWSGLGLVLPVLLIAGLGFLLGYNLPARALQFAGTVTQGDLGRAREFIPRCLWVTEGGLTLAWAAAFPVLGLLALRRKDPGLLLWPGFTLLLALLLVAPSDLLQKFALSARHVRVLAPFLCLGVAAVLPALHPDSARRRYLNIMLGFGGLLAAINFTGPLTQTFPDEFQRLAARTITDASRQDLGPYVVTNGRFLHNPDWIEPAPEPGTVLLRRPHPFSFTPYLYEGYPAAVRTRYQQYDLSMRLSRLQVSPIPVRGQSPGLLALTLRFPEHPLGLQPEPLLTTGEPGRGDVLFIRYVDADHFHIGHDHWGGDETLSPLLTLDRNRAHELLVSLGSFYPPDTAIWSNRLFVSWDGTIVFDSLRPFHPSAPEHISVGHNFIGSSTAVAHLSADILHLSRQDPTLKEPAFAHHPGALRFQLQFPLTPPGTDSDPLISTGRTNEGDLLFIRYEGADQIRLGLEHRPGPVVLSDPVSLDRTKLQNLVVSLGSLYPSTNPNPRHERWQRTLYVRWNDTVVLNRSAAFYPSESEQITIGRNQLGTPNFAPWLTARLLDISETASVALPAIYGGYPGVLRLVLRPFAPPVPGRSEPLVSTGEKGAGDLLFLRWEDATHFRIGRDHWGHPAIVSEPIAWDRTSPLALTISLGSLFPAASDDFFQIHPDWVRLKHHLFVATDDTVILNEPAAFYEAAAETIAVGFNRIEASTAGPDLLSDVVGEETLSPEIVLPRLDSP